MTIHGSAGGRDDEAQLADCDEERAAWPLVTVVIVTYRAEGYVEACLDSLAATKYPRLRIVVVDNASNDQTAATVERWMAAADPLGGDHAPSVEIRTDVAPGTAARAPSAGLVLLKAADNRGFAAGVNLGLAAAAADRACDLFWILNPDTVVEPDCPFALVAAARRAGRFAVVGGRVFYQERPGHVQTDGGRLHPLTGTAVSVNIGAPETAAMPLADSLDYISGVSMLVSRAFVEQAGPMPEQWFLYYEEIDWQLRRGDLPLVLAPAARIHHAAGASIGSGAVHRRAGAVSVYFSCRNLLPFVSRVAPHKLPFAYAHAYYKLVRQWGVDRDNVAALLRGLHGFGPPRCVREKVPKEAWRRESARRTRPPLAAGRMDRRHRAS